MNYGNLQLLEVIRSNHNLESLCISSTNINEPPIILGCDLGGCEPIRVMSVTKALFALLVLVAHSEGLIRSLDAPIVDLHTELLNPKILDKFQHLTVRQLLNMTSGIEWNEEVLPYDSQHNDAYIMVRYGDWLEYLSSKNFLSGKSQDFYYNSGLYLLAGSVFEKLTGLKIEEYANKKLFHPLGISEVFWQRHRMLSHLPDTSAGISISLVNLATVGSAIIREVGVSRGTGTIKYLVNSSYTLEANGTKMGYALGWWRYVCPLGEEFLFARGSNGAHLVLAPSLRIAFSFVKRLGLKVGFEQRDRFRLAHPAALDIIRFFQNRLRLKTLDEMG